MKKIEVIKGIQEKVAAQDIKLSMKDIEVVTDALYDTIVEAVMAGEKVKFGEVTYSVKDVPERSGIIQMGAEKGGTWTKPAHKEIAVKASKALKGLAE